MTTYNRRMGQPWDSDPHRRAAEAIEYERTAREQEARR